MKRTLPIIALLLAAATLSSCSENSSASNAGAAATTTTTITSVTSAEIDTTTAPAETTTTTEPAPVVTEVPDGTVPEPTTGSSGLKKTPPHDFEEDYPDKIYYNSEQNVTFGVMRCENTYLTFSSDLDYAGWCGLYGEMPGEVDLSDGEFAFITADITRISGGVAGFMGNPRIDKLISVQSATLEQMTEYAGIEQYDPEERYFNGPRTYGDYLIVQLGNIYHIYRGGEFINSCGTQLEVNMALGLVAVEDGAYELRDMGNMYVSVFCVGDVVLGHCSNISMSRRWQPILNSEFTNSVPGYELSDGQAGYMLNADITRVNGSGYENSPLITGAHVMEIVDYDVLVMKNGIPTVGEGMRDGNVVFDRNTEGTWLVFELDGMFYVYLDDRTDRYFVSSYNSLEDAVMRVNKNTEYAQTPAETVSDIGVSYAKPAEEEDIVKNSELGFDYVKNQLLVSFNNDADKAEIQEIFDRLGVKVVGYIEITNDYQIEFDRDMTCDELMDVINMLEAYPFVYSAWFNTVSYITYDD